MLTKLRRAVALIGSSFHAPWSVTLIWGDGKPNTTFSREAAGDLPAENHAYDADGQYTVQVIVDDGFAEGTGSFQVNVAKQETGILLGTVYEDKNKNEAVDSGEGVQGASVTLTEVSAAAFTNPVTTNAEGNYVFADVPVGSYLLTVSAAGFTSPPPLGVTVQADTTATVDPIALTSGDDGLSVYLPAVQSSSTVQAGEESVSR